MVENTNVQSQQQSQSSEDIRECNRRLSKDIARRASAISKEHMNACFQGKALGHLTVALRNAAPTEMNCGLRGTDGLVTHAFVHFGAIDEKWAAFDIPSMKLWKHWNLDADAIVTLQSQLHA